MISKIISGFIVICVGVSLLPEVKKCLYNGSNLMGRECNTQKHTKQSYEEYVRERLNVERMMK